MNVIRKIYIKWLCIIGRAIDIKSDGKYPGNMLSNFAPYCFIFRGIRFCSMESLLQGLKFADVDAQNEVFTIVGVNAKKKGKNQKWFSDQTLYWQGMPMKRDSREYASLIKEAYDALFRNSDFRKTLQNTGKKRLFHTIGESDPTKTVLTEKEFCNVLVNLRQRFGTGANGTQD